MCRRRAARVKVSAAPGPLCQISKKKVVDVSRPTWRVKILAAAGPPCVKSPKKRSLMFLDRRCVSKFRPRPGPPVSNLQKKRSLMFLDRRCVSKLCPRPGPSVSNLPKKGRCPCQILGRRGPVSNFGAPGAPCQSVKFRPAPGPLLSRSFCHPKAPMKHFTSVVTPSQTLWWSSHTARSARGRPHSLVM